MLNSKSLTAKNGEIAFMLDGEFRIIVHFLIADQPLEAHCEGQQKNHKPLHEKDLRTHHQPLGLNQRSFASKGKAMASKRQLANRWCSRANFAVFVDFWGHALRA